MHILFSSQLYFFHLFSIAYTEYVDVYLSNANKIMSVSMPSEKHCHDSSSNPSVRFVQTWTEAETKVNRSCTGGWGRKLHWKLKRSSEYY